MGQLGYNANDRLRALLDEFLVFNRALSPAKIVVLYQGTTSP